MHLIAKRTLKREFKPLDTYNAMMRGPTYPPPCGPPRPMVIERTPPQKRIRIGTRRNIYGSDVSDSDSSSGSTVWSSDSSVGQVRRQLRKFKTRKITRERWDSDGSEREVDVIKVNVELKRGDDVVKTLLDLWTAVGEMGKTKGKAV